MIKHFTWPARLFGVLLAGLALGLSWQPAQAQHDIRGIQPTNGAFNLYAYPANIPLPVLYTLMRQDAEELWGYVPGKSVEDRPPLLVPLT